MFSKPNTKYKWGEMNRCKANLYFQILFLMLVVPRSVWLQTTIRYTFKHKTKPCKRISIFAQKSYKLGQFFTITWQSLWIHTTCPASFMCQLNNEYPLKISGRLQTHPAKIINAEIKQNPSVKGKQPQLITVNSCRTKKCTNYLLMCW